METLTLNSEQETVETTPKAKTSISLAKAKERTKNWRAVAEPLFEGLTPNIPKGFVIPMETLKALATQYPDAVGARVYFTLDKPGFAPNAGITGVLVPVVADGKIGYKDVIVSNPENEYDTSIYDFTAPCPRFCDPDSWLF